MDPERDISTERYYHGVDMIALISYILRRAYWVVLAAVIGAAMAGFYVTRYVDPVYQATSKIYIAGSDTTISMNDLQLGSSLVADYQEALKSSYVCDMVNERLGTRYSYDALGRMVSTSNPSGSHLLYITVTSTKPEEARSLADAFAEAAQDYIENVMEMRRPQLLEQARMPVAPVSPNMKRSVRNGAVVGGLVCAIALALFFLLDDSVRSDEDITSAVRLPVFGSMPLQDRKHAKPIEEIKDIPASEDMPLAVIRGGLSLDRSGAESVDAICTGISFAGNQLKTIAITSCRPDEGKSFLAMQLSRCMARRGIRTLLIDCDLRKSVMRDGGLIRFSGRGIGLAHVLSGQCDLSDALYATNVPDLFLLPGGENVKAPLALISSADFDDLLKKLSCDFEMIFIDTPPVGSVIDAAEIARRCDGSMIVVENKRTSRRALKEVVDRLRKTQTPILGCIRNKVPPRRRKTE